MADNQSAIALSRNAEFHKQTKYFNVTFHYQQSVLNDQRPLSISVASQESTPPRLQGNIRDSAGALSTLFYPCGFEWFYRGLTAQREFSIALPAKRS
ncbi:hypothetical protein VN97_g9486 [Penicillium thymicola]|nr:hypothetical protein VN97_g9486 [Penicillium thymicola]